MYSLDFRIVIIKKGEIVEAMPSKIILMMPNVEAMPSKVILMMPKNQELSKVSSKDSRIKFQVSRLKIQESRFKNNQDQDSRLKIQESREDSIKISIKKVFLNIE